MATGVAATVVMAFVRENVLLVWCTDFTPASGSVDVNDDDDGLQGDLVEAVFVVSFSFLFLVPFLFPLLTDFFPFLLVVFLLAVLVFTPVIGLLVGDCGRGLGGCCGCCPLVEGDADDDEIA